MTLERIRLRIILFLIFLLISFLFISPESQKERSQFHSEQLNKITVSYGNTERTDYTDVNGQIAIAADLGYATVIATKTDYSKSEQYFDNKGEPISRYNGHYAALYEYDKKGNIIRISYLDIDGAPMITANGYAIEEKEYNENRQVISAWFYDTGGNPVLTPLYGYGKVYEYNENGKNYKTTFVDRSGAPMMTEQGFSIIKRNYYFSDGNENGKAESEFYFDEKGFPVSLSLGQYGVHLEYDEYGRGSVLTYLDANGKTIATNKGYTTVVRTYHANGSIATEQYYDLKGNPFALSEGQYGIKVNEGQTVYLDQNGKESFNLKKILYNYTRIVIPLVLSFVIFSSMVGKKQNEFFLILCIAAIVYMTLLFRDNDSSGNSGLLRYYRRILFDSEARADIIKNIWLFIPFGVVLYRLYPSKIILLVPIVLSALIEGIQWFAGIGTCELDDIISNGLGGWIGFRMSKLAIEIKLCINNKKQTHSA